MSLLVSPQPVPLTTDEAGVIRVGGTRVSLDSVVYDYKQGATAEQIAFDFPTLELADIHAVISYYLRNRNQVEEYLAEQQRLADDVRQQIAPIVANEGIRERLLARRAKSSSQDASRSDG